MDERTRLDEPGRGARRDPTVRALERHIARNERRLAEIEAEREWLDSPAFEADCERAAAEDAARRTALAGEQERREQARDSRRREQEAARAEASEARLLAAAEHECSVPDCHRTRHFFDAEGAGYCKRHANERGIRPRGKV
jgi:hypothetical protein